jgi:hypothetical protein
MRNSKGIEIILISVTIAMAAVTSLFTANVTIAQQQADAFSKYDIDTADVANRKLTKSFNRMILETQLNPHLPYQLYLPYQP